MSQEGNNNASETDGSTSRSDSTQSPTISSPIEIRSKKRRFEANEGEKSNEISANLEENNADPVPTVLPFSDTTFDNDTTHPSTAHDNDSDELIIRGTRETRDLQIRLFQLKMETKRVMDELHRRIPGFADDQDANDQDTAVLDISISPTARRKDQNTDKTNSPRQFAANEDSAKIEELESNTSRLTVENDHLRQQITTLTNQNRDLQRRNSEVDKELTGLKSLLSEKELALERLEGSMRSQERIINAERSRTKLLQESKRHADEMTRRLREQIDAIRESGRYPASGEIRQNLSSEAKVERLETELEKAKAEKSQISALLIEERSITEELQQNLDQLHNENSGQEALNLNRSQELENMRSENRRLVDEMKDASKQKDSLMVSLKSLQVQFTDLTKEAGEQEKKNSELQLLVTFKDRHMEEKSKLLTEKQEIIKQQTSELELRGSEIKHLNEQLKQTEIARTALQHNLDETRLELNEARTAIQSKDARLEKLEAELRIKREELEKTSDSISQLRSSAEKEISSLKNEILTANNHTANLIKEHEINLEKFSQTYTLQLEKQSQEAQAKLSALQAKYTSLSVQSADLKREILGKDAEKDDLLSQNQELLARAEKHAKDAKDLERKHREIDHELQDLHSQYNAAKSEVRMKTLELQQKTQMQDVLTSRVQELEKTISNQSVKLNQISTSEIGKLRKTAEENLHAAGELARVKVEWEMKYNEWLRYHEYAETAISSLNIAKSELEAQLNTLKSNETQREKMFRESVQIEYDNQFNYMKSEFEYKMTSLEKRLGCISADLMAARSEKDQAVNQLSQLESALQESINEIRKSEKEVARLNQQVSAATEHESTISAENASLASEVRSLSARIQEHQSTHDSQNALIAKLEKDLNAKDMTVQEYSHNLNQLQDEFTKLKHYSALMSHHAWNFVNYSLNEIQKLLFVKKMYTRLLPRIDHTLTNRYPATKPKNKLRKSFLVALAIVRFKNAAREGLKKKCSESQEFVRGHYSQ